jgi:hypothetical protein
MRFAGVTLAYYNKRKMSNSRCHDEPSGLNFTDCGAKDPGGPRAMSSLVSLYDITHKYQQIRTDKTV